MANGMRRLSRKRLKIRMVEKVGKMQQTSAFPIQRCRKY